MSSKQIGKMGEDLAVEFLKRNNHNILERNYRNRIGEIDIIAEDGPVLCFIEVKTRTSDSFGLPQEAISKAKQRKIAQTVLIYLKTHKKAEADFRFDGIAVMIKPDENTPQINWIKNAFELDGQYAI